MPYDQMTIIWIKFGHFHFIYSNKCIIFVYICHLLFYTKYLTSNIFAFVLGGHINPSSYPSNDHCWASTFEKDADILVGSIIGSFRRISLMFWCPIEVRIKFYLYIYLHMKYLMN